MNDLEKQFRDMCQKLQDHGEIEYYQNLMAGVYAYGLEKTSRLYFSAEKTNGRLYFFYRNEEDLLSDKLSYKFIAD